MRQSKTRIHFSRAMARASSSAATLGPRVSTVLSDEWRALEGGASVDAHALHQFLAAVLARTARVTADDTGMMRARARLEDCRRRHEEARVELRSELLALKKIAEVALGKEAGRGFLLLPDRLPVESLVLQEMATGTVGRLRDPELALPSVRVPLVLDRAVWAESLADKTAALVAATLALEEERRTVITCRDNRGRALDIAERHGRAAWLMLKGLYLFADQAELIKDLERGRRPRGKTVDAGAAADGEAERIQAIPIAQPAIIEVPRLAANREVLEPAGERVARSEPIAVAPDPVPETGTEVESGPASRGYSGTWASMPNRAVRPLHPAHGRDEFGAEASGDPGTRTRDVGMKDPPRGRDGG